VNSEKDDNSFYFLNRLNENLVFIALTLPPQE